MKTGYEISYHHTRPQPGERCSNCGADKGLEVAYRHVGGHGPVRVVECLDLGRCWIRKDGGKLQ